MDTILKSKQTKKNRYDGTTIKYSNELARKYSILTLEEQKALHIILSHVEPFKKNPTVFEINKVDFFTKLNLQGDDKYKRYKQLANNLIMKTFVEIDNEESNNKGVVIYNVEWKKKDSFFEVSLNPRFMPFLEQFISYYTKIDLDSFVRFKSKHALTLYKFFCSWNSEKKSILTTKQLKELFGLTKEKYVQNGKFNRAAFERDTVNKSINEINKYSNFTITYTKTKKSNKVLNYSFSWEEKFKQEKRNKDEFENKNVLNSDFFIDEEIRQTLLDIDNC